MFLDDTQRHFALLAQFRTTRERESLRWRVAGRHANAFCFASAISGKAQTRIAPLTCCRTTRKRKTCGAARSMPRLCGSFYPFYPVGLLGHSLSRAGKGCAFLASLGFGSAKSSASECSEFPRSQEPRSWNAKQGEGLSLPRPRGRLSAKIRGRVRAKR